MIHWVRLRPPVRAVIIVCVVLGAAGCRSKDNRTTPSAGAVTTPRPPAAGLNRPKSAEPVPPAAGATTKTPPEKAEKKPGDVGALAQGLDLTLADNKTGVIVARIKASTGAVGMTGPEEGAAGALSNGIATLYDKGKPAATVTADRIFADQATRTITGKGHVVARSLIHKGAPTVRADTMVWRYADRTIRGNGNVIMSQEPSIFLRGERFVANTELRKVEVFAE